MAHEKEEGYTGWYAGMTEKHYDAAISRAIAAHEAEMSGGRADGELLAALKLVMPLAKGYAAAHPVGSNAAYVHAAEEAIQRAEQSPDQSARLRAGLIQLGAERRRALDAEAECATLRVQLTATQDKLAAAEKDADWQHMETAPRDGGEVLIRVQRAGTVGALIAHYMEGGHCIEDHPPIARGWYFWTGYDFRPTESAPTGWLPIPPTSAYQAEIAARRAAIASSKEQS